MEQLGHFRILGRIGAGGMGEVYRARDENLQRDVAIKLLPASSFTDSAARSRLIREARAEAALNHPNICTVFDAGEADGQAFIAMEYVEGEPLDRRIARGALPPATVVEYGIELAAALAHAHDHGIVHRDLKPGNVIVTAENRLKVLDFGLAKRVTEAPVGTTTATAAMLTNPGTMVGTPAYMAPEQLHGQPADARSDIWALGVILYEMASGTRPFNGNTWPELCSAILTSSPRPLTSIPSALQPIIERCLAKDPAARYQRAGEVRAALEAVRTGEPAPSSRRRIAIAAGALVLLLALVVGALSFNRSRTGTFAEAPRIESIAVLPLENLSGDAGQDYFADGIHEALITDLAKFSGIRKVIARSSVMRYRKTDIPLPQIARELGVDALITGSVLRSGDRVQITAHLIRAATEEQLWAERYERQLRDVLSLQNEIVAAVTQKIQLQLTAQDRARLATARVVNPEAYRLYLLGRYQWQRRTPEGFQKAAEYFQKAIDVDPTYAPAYAGLADNYATQPAWGTLRPDEGYPRSKGFAQRALQIDDSLAEPYASLGLVSAVYEWDWTAAERNYRRAVELNPNYATAHHWYAWYLAFVGRHDESIAEMKRAAELDPLSLVIAINVARMYFHARRFNESEAAARNVLTLDPTFAEAHATLGRTYLVTGRPNEAVPAFQRAEELFSERREYAAMLAEAYVLTNRTAEARAILAQLEKESAGTYVPAYNIALVYLRLGDKDRVFQWLEKSAAQHERELVTVNVEPRFDALRSDPRFRTLIRKMNFPG